MRQMCLGFLVLSTLGCGGSDPVDTNAKSEAPSNTSSNSGWRDTVGEILEIEGLARHTAACDFLSVRDAIPQLYTVPTDSITYRPMTIKSIPHAYCGALWAKPNQAELKAAYKLVIADYGKRKVKAMLARESFDEEIPKPIPDEFSISLTIASPMFDTSAEAIQALRSQRKALAQGVDVEVMGEERTVRMDDIQEWIDDIGDGGTWAPSGDGLSVVYEGVILTTTANGFGNSDTNRARAKELANYVISGG